MGDNKKQEVDNHMQYLQITAFHRSSFLYLYPFFLHRINQSTFTIFESCERSAETTSGGKNMVQQIQKGRKSYISIMVSKCRRMKNIEESFEDSGKLKEGYFSVVVQEDGKPKKLFISLRYLSYPPFLSLLDAAEKEFGFDQKGVLEIPCEARELQNILSRRSSIFKKENTCKT